MRERLIGQAIQGTMALMFTSSAVTVIGFLSTLVMARYIPSQAFGMGLTAVAAGGVLASWSGLGLESVLVADIARELGEGNQASVILILRQYTIVRFIAAVFILLMAIPGLAGLFLPRLPVNRELVITTVLLVIAQAFYQITSTAFMAYQKFELYGLQNLIRALTRLGVAIMLPLIQWKNGSAVVFAYALGNVIAWGAFAPWLFSKLTEPLSSKPSLDLWLIFRKHGKWALINTLTKRTLDPFPTFILAGILGTEAVAIFRVASRFVELLSMPISVIGQVLTPIFAERIPSLSELGERVTKYSLWIAVLLTGLTAIIAPISLPLLFGEEYRKSVGIIWWLLPLFFTKALRVRQRPTLYVLRSQRTVWLTYSLSTFAGLGLTALLTWLAGLRGFVSAEVLKTMLVAVTREAALARRNLAISWRHLLTIDDVDKDTLRTAFLLSVKKALSRWRM